MMNHQQRKEAKEDEKAAKEVLAYHQENIVNALAGHTRMLEKALDKIDSGLDAMKEKYAEDRLLRLKGD